MHVPLLDLPNCLSSVFSPAVAPRQGFFGIPICMVVVGIILGAGVVNSLSGELRLVFASDPVVRYIRVSLDVICNLNLVFVLFAVKWSFGVPTK